MTLILKSILLGIIQGLTEFLPVSSSGHLVLMQLLLQVDALDVTFDVFLHFGTLLAILIVFRGAIWTIIKPIFSGSSSSRVSIRLIGKIVVTGIPAVIIGLLFQDKIQNAFHYLPLLCVAFLTTGTFLWFTRNKVDTHKEIGYLDALIIGMAQSLALLPGISRSGMTISTALLLNNNREESAEFSFLIAIPLILGATLIKLGEVIGDPELLNNWPLYLVGALTAFLIGWLSLTYLIRVVRQGKLSYFSYYCWGLGLVCLVAYFF